MYFDQFSLISPLHLVLVSVGIAVLLGGVWVVSIQSGGGGIDLGTWDEEIVDLSTEDSEAILEYNETEVISTTETMPLLEQPTNICQERIAPTAMERGTRSESSSGTDRRGSGRTPRVSLSPDGRSRSRRAHTLYASPRVPSIQTAGLSNERQPARISSSPSELSLLDRIVSHTRIPMHQATSSFHLPHPHGSLSSALGPALQIGLSPVSPGFAILPLERRKTSVYAAGGDCTVNGDGGLGRRRYWKAQRRRTVSDGEVSRMGRDSTGRPAERMDRQGVVEAFREGWVERPQIETDPPEILRQEESAISQRTEHRWRWFMDLFPR